MSTLQELHRKGAALLKHVERPGLESKVLLLEAARLGELDFLSEPGRLVSDTVAARFRRMVARRRVGLPLAYIIGRKEFWSLDFQVGPGVFVPRPETELLVELAVERAGRPDPLILDLGTGSGNIALALAAELPEAYIIGVDVSSKALASARRNARRLKLGRIGLGLGQVGPKGKMAWVGTGTLSGCMPDLSERDRNIRATRGRVDDAWNLDRRTQAASRPESQVIFLRSLFFSGLARRRPRPRFDVIVSNPPYVSEKEWRKFSPARRRHEPKRALVPGPSGLEAIRRIVRESPEWLKPGGWLVLEIGAGQRRSVLALFDGQRWQDVRCHKDLSGLDRAVTARRAGEA